MGLLQGASELFPVSSLGHAVLVPSLLRWTFKQSDPSFVPFLVLLHLGTATALLVIYRDEWVAIIRGFFTAAVRGEMRTEPERLSFLLATPVILGAGIVEVPQLFTNGVPLGEYLAAAVLSGVAAYASARFLLRYFRSGRLDPYGWYCIAAGLVSLALLRFSL